MLSLGALGIVYGDIGTSPIYTVQTVFNPSDPHPVAVSSESVYGVVFGRFTPLKAGGTITADALKNKRDLVLKS